MIENAEFGRMEWPFSVTVYSTAYSTSQLSIENLILMKVHVTHLASQLDLAQE